MNKKNSNVNLKNKNVGLKQSVHRNGKMLNGVQSRTNI
jgi:hypothetical protein